MDDYKQLRKELTTFYYSSALCNLHLMNHSTDADNSLSYNSLLYLELIHSMDGHCTASRIADLLGISRPAVTLKVNDLIRKGLVTKTKNPDDGRSNLLAVNEENVPRFRVYRKMDNNAVEKILDNFSHEDVQKFCRMLKILSDINILQMH